MAAESFDQDLSPWDISGVKIFDGIFENTGFADCNKEAIYRSWGLVQKIDAFLKADRESLNWQSVKCVQCRSFETFNKKQKRCEPVMWLDVATCLDMSPRAVKEVDDAAASLSDENSFVPPLTRPLLLSSASSSASSLLFQSNHFLTCKYVA